MSNGTNAMTFYASKHWFDTANFTFQRTRGDIVYFDVQKAETKDGFDYVTYAKKDAWASAGRPQEFTGVQAREYGLV